MILQSLKKYIVQVSIFSLILGPAIAPKANASVTIGADIYCFMRKGGNDHPSSWEAAYQFIKKQTPGFFKTSPKQAAGMIVEVVVQDPEKYGNCNGYLGDLFTGETTVLNQELDVTPVDSEVNTTKTPKGVYVDPYSY